MIKLLSIDEIGKQDDRKRQQEEQPKKTPQGILGLKSKLSLFIGSMLSLDLAFILLILG